MLFVTGREYPLLPLLPKGVTVSPMWDLALGTGSDSPPEQARGSRISPWLPLNPLLDGERP